MNELYEFRKEDAYRFADVVGIEAHTHGDELQFRYCPYCNGGLSRDKKTFAINLKTGAWNCKRGSCGRKGNMITLAQDFDGFSLGDGIDDYYLRRERYKNFIRKPIETKDAAIEYLKSRGIPEEVTRKYEITTRKDNDNVLVFPFIDENENFCFVKYRNIAYEKGATKGSKEWCEKDRKPILFGMNHCNFNGDRLTLVMTEGQIDSLSCAAAGIENAVSVPLGKNGFTWIPYCFNFLGRFDELIIFGDYENGEISLLDGMKTRFNGCIRHVREEDYRGCKDANEILIKYGAEAIRQCIVNAKAVDVHGLKSIKDVQRVNLADLDRMKTGIRLLDEKCPFIFGELIVLTGAAGDGKSTLASQWVTMALNQGYPSMIYSGEMKSWQVKNWIDFQIAGARNLNRYDDIEDNIYDQMAEWDMYERLYLYDVNEIEDDQEMIFQVMKKGIQQYGIRFIVVDNLMTAMDYSSGLELNDAQTVFTKRLARMAQDMNVIIVLVVHPRKGKIGAFSNDDIAGSSNIVNRAHKTIRYARPSDDVTDPYGNTYTKDNMDDCPVRILTVMKDRMTGHTISRGIILQFEERTKRISDDGDFGWRLKWENAEQAEFANMYTDDIIPF